MLSLTTDRPTDRPHKTQKQNHQIRIHSFQWCDEHHSQSVIWRKEKRKCHQYKFGYKSFQIRKTEQTKLPRRAAIIENLYTMRSAFYHVLRLCWLIMMMPRLQRIQIGFEEEHLKIYNNTSMTDTTAKQTNDKQNNWLTIVDLLHL